MALTALDLDTGSVVFPFDNGCRKAMCRDPHCRGQLVAVRESKYEDVTMRRSHWRHQVKVKCSTNRGAAGSKETLWHADWKSRCGDPERVEYRHALRRGPDRVSVRTADVWTRFSWALEFQHSNISLREARRRENHYQGKVLWIVDCASERNPNGAFDVDGAYIRWHAARDWIGHTRALVAVDDGVSIHLLPPNFAAQLKTNRDRIYRDSVVTYDHAAFVEIWINGAEHPLGPAFASNWTLERRERAKSRELNRQIEALVESSFRRARFGSLKCTYGGDRGRLVYIQDRMFQIEMCKVDGCRSAASFDQTCYAHSSAPLALEETR